MSETKVHVSAVLKWIGMQITPDYEARNPLSQVSEWTSWQEAVAIVKMDAALWALLIKGEYDICSWVTVSLNAGNQPIHIQHDISRFPSHFLPLHRYTLARERWAESPAALLRVGSP